MAEILLAPEPNYKLKYQTLKDQICNTIEIS